MMEGGVGVAGNGRDLLGGQSTKQDSIVLEEGLFTVNSAGVKDRKPHAKLTWVMSRKFLGI
jgi:hypothetical protein